MGIPITESLLETGNEHSANQLYANKTLLERTLQPAEAPLPCVSGPHPSRPSLSSGPSPSPPGPRPLPPAAQEPWTCGATTSWESRGPRQVGEKSGVPKEERGVWGSHGGGKDIL